MSHFSGHFEGASTFLTPKLSLAALGTIEGVSHQWCDHFYRLLYSSTRHIERWKEGKETLN
jgi:hypothetical protein